MPQRSSVPDSSQLYFHGSLSVPQGRFVAPLGLSSLPETFHTPRLVTAGSLALLCLHRFLLTYRFCSVKRSKADSVRGEELGIISGIVSSEVA